MKFTEGSLVSERNKRTVKDRIIITKPSQISVRVFVYFPSYFFPIDLRYRIRLSGRSV